MRVFITGAAGWIGSTLSRGLVAAGHEVVGLARSEASAERVRRLGGRAVLGDMSDHNLLVAEAEQADAVAHLAFELDFNRFDQAVDNELTLLRKMSTALAGSGKAFIAASGTPILLGRIATEQDVLDPSGPAGVRAATASAVLALSEQGIRSGIVRMPRSVHGEGDRHGLIAMLVAANREMGIAAYVGDGQNRWPAVHISDAGHLFHLAIEEAPAGSVLHAVAEEGVPMHTVADVIAAKTGLPAGPIDPERMGVFGALLGCDQPASSDITRRLLGWEPTGPSLLEDLEAGYYTS